MAPCLLQSQNAFALDEGSQKMLTVHVWTPTITKKGPLVGHASVTLGADYISWCPERGAFEGRRFLAGHKADLGRVLRDA
jgi:hypothetical protein